MLALVILILIFILAFSGTPLFVIMAIGALLGFYFISQVDIAIIIQEAYRLASAPALIAIPLFTVGGYILAESKAPERLLRFTKAAVGWIPGGVPLVILIVTSVFTALTGASGITIVALGGLLFPILKKAGYSENFSLGIITSTGSIGLLFPPSLPIILYGVISQTAVNELFIAGILPGLLLILSFFIFSMITSLGKKIQREKFDIKEFISATRSAIFEIPLPIFIVLGIYTGKFTASEAAIVTVVWVIIVEFFIYRDIKIKDFPKIIRESMLLIGAIMAILSMAMGFTNFLVDQQIPQKLFEFSKQYIDSKISFLIVLNIFLLIVGTLMDIFSAIVVVVPLIYPVAQSYGIDPVHLGIIFLANLEIGYLTPPVGLNLFISSFRFNKPITQIYKLVVPFISILLICLLIITYVPELSLRTVKGIVEGYVENEDGKPLKTKIGVSGLEQEITTDENGRFKIYLSLPDFSKPHEFSISFIAQGYAATTENIKIKRGQKKRIKIKLKKEENNTETIQ